MAEKMVRTQVYLPRAIYSKLQERAERHGLTLAVQIREALEAYLRRTNGAAEAMEPLDFGNLFEIIGKHGGSGLDDGAERHDQYIYGDPHGEQRLARRGKHPRAKPKPSSAARERPVAYRTKKRSTSKRRGTRR